MLPQSICSLPKDRLQSPTFSQLCWPQGQSAACLCNPGSRGSQGELIPAPSLSHSCYYCPHYRELAASSWCSISPKSPTIQGFWEGLSFSCLLSPLQNQALRCLDHFLITISSYGNVTHQLFISSQDCSARSCHKKRIMCCLQCLTSAPRRHYALLSVVTKWWNSYGHLQITTNAVTGFGKEAGEWVVFALPF